jgi:transaldolase
MEASPTKKSRTESALSQLQEYTVVVADTGDFDSIRKFNPTDATTNPSLLLKAATMPQYVSLLDEAVAYAKASALTGQDQLDLAMCVPRRHLHRWSS